MTLLLGPPGSGKTTLLKAIAGKLDLDLRVCDPPHKQIVYFIYDLLELLTSFLISDK